MKERSWFIEHGYRYDLKNHCWLQDDISNIVEIGKNLVEKNKIGDGVEMPHSSESSNLKPFSNIKNQKTNSEPIFFKLHNIMIFNNCQYPLKFHEVMFEK